LDIGTLKNIIRPEDDTDIPKPCVSLKKGKTLGKTLVRAKLKTTNNPPKYEGEIALSSTPNLGGHSAGCATPGCKCCRTMSRKVRAISSSNHKSYPTPKHTNCKTTNVIYLLECTKCTHRNQYVGQTKRQLSQRLSGHRAASQHKTTLPIYKHFNTNPDRNFERDTRLTVLEKCKETRPANNT